MSAQETSQPDSLPYSDSELARHRWRYKEARRLGMEWRDAKLFASSRIDIEDMRALIRHGCPPGQVLRILL